MVRLFRLILVLLSAMAVMMAVPSIASADPASFPINVEKTGTLLDPTLVRVRAEFNCLPMEVWSNQGGAELRQAVSGKIAYGNGYQETPIVCDGTPHTVSFLVWVDTASPAPFKQGGATVLISAFLCPPTPTPIDACQSGSSGITVIRLRW